MEASRLLPVAETGQAPVHVFAADIRMLLLMLAFVVSTWGFQAIGLRRNWQVATWPSHASLIALFLAFLGEVGANRHLLYAPGWVIWTVAIGLHAHMLYLNDRDATEPARRSITSATHVGGVWLATAVLADCLWLGVDRARLWDTSWSGVVFLASVTAVLVALTLWAGRAMAGQGETWRWPLDRHAPAYGWVAAAPIAVLVVMGALSTALGASGRANPLPYVPLLNPVDLTVALAIAALALWRGAMLGARSAPPGVEVLRGPGSVAAMTGLAFIAVNTAWLRAAHQLLGVDWNSDALLGSVVVQTGLAILWTLLALPLMVFAHRRESRTLWLVGAGLLGLTVAKLLLVDLNNAGGGARIVAFIVVGVLMLVVGYLAPLPPKAGRDEPLEERSVAA